MTKSFSMYIILQSINFRGQQDQVDSQVKKDSGGPREILVLLVTQGGLDFLENREIMELQEMLALLGRLDLL